MGTASRFILINLALANLLLPSNVAASPLSEQGGIMIASNVAFDSEIMFEPANGGECRGDSKCAAGGAY